MSLIKKYDQIEVHSGEEHNSVDIYLNMKFMSRPLKKATLYKNGVLRFTPKSKVNIFKLFGEGIGVNEEIILNLNFNVLECEINGNVYQTTKDHLKKKAIRSPYQSTRVDRQWILKLDDFHIPEKVETEIESPTLFESVS